MDFRAPPRWTDARARKHDPAQRYPGPVTEARRQKPAWARRPNRSRSDPLWEKPKPPAESLNTRLGSRLGFGADSQIAIPAPGFWQCRKKSLTEDRIRSLACCGSKPFAFRAAPTEGGGVAHGDAPGVFADGYSAGSGRATGVSRIGRWIRAAATPSAAPIHQTTS